MALAWSQRSMPLISCFCMRKTSGSNKSGWTDIRPWFWTDEAAMISQLLVSSDVYVRTWREELEEVPRSSWGFATCTSRNFRVLHAADVYKKQPGYFEYKEGWQLSSTLRHRDWLKILYGMQGWAGWRRELIFCCGNNLSGGKWSPMCQHSPWVSKIAGISRQTPQVSLS